MKEGYMAYNLCLNQRSLIKYMILKHSANKPKNSSNSTNFLEHFSEQGHFQTIGSRDKRAADDF